MRTRSIAIACLGEVAILVGLVRLEVAQATGGRKEGTCAAEGLSASALQVKSDLDAHGWNGSAAELPMTPLSPECPEVLKGISAVVLNLKRRPDRWQEVSRSISSHAPWLPIMRLDAVDGRAAPPPLSEVTEQYTADRYAPFKKHSHVENLTLNMSVGERGCCASHIRAWMRAAKSETPLLVFEDDAVAQATFVSSLAKSMQEAPRDTDMIFLTDLDYGTPKPAGQVLMEPEFVWTTSGYVIFPAAARTLLTMLPVDMPVDNFLGWQIRKGKIKGFSMRPSAIRQANPIGIKSDVRHSDDAIFHAAIGQPTQKV